LRQMTHLMEWMEGGLHISAFLCEGFLEASIFFGGENE
jgi:hypothetical protein